MRIYIFLLIFNIFTNIPNGLCNCPSKIIGMRTTGNHTKILLKNNKKTLKIMHITDSHITIPDAKDSLIWDKCKRMHKAYENTKSHVSKKNVSREDAFKILINQAKKLKVDIIALTGDIINFPSEKSADFVYNTLKDNEIPYLYVAGNHDWHLEGTPGNSENLRDETLHILESLYQQKNPLYNATLINGINFICIDNSTYQINKKQLAFFKDELKKGYPIVLLMHIPVYTSFGIQSTMGNPAWGADIDKSYIIEKRERWSKEGNTTTTKEFYQLIMNTPDIIVLSGHIHTNSMEIENNLIQFTTGMSRDGHYRIIEFTK